MNKIHSAKVVLVWRPSLCQEEGYFVDQVVLAEEGNILVFLVVAFLVVDNLVVFFVVHYVNAFVSVDAVCFVVYAHTFVVYACDEFVVVVVF